MGQFHDAPPKKIKHTDFLGRGLQLGLGPRDKHKVVAALGERVGVGAANAVGGAGHHRPLAVLERVDATENKLNSGVGTQGILYSILTADWACATIKGKKNRGSFVQNPGRKKKKKKKKKKKNTTSASNGRKHESVNRTQSTNGSCSQPT